MLTINISEVVLTVLNFFLLFFILRRFLYTPILNFTSQRRKRIEDGLAQESAAIAAMEEKRQELEHSRCNAQMQAKRITDEAQARRRHELAQSMERMKKQAMEESRISAAKAHEEHGEEILRLEENSARMASMLAARLLSAK